MNLPELLSDPVAPIPNLPVASNGSPAKPREELPVDRVDLSDPDRFDASGLASLLSLLDALPAPVSDATQMFGNITRQVGDRPPPATAARLMDGFETSLTALIQADPDLTMDFLALVQALLTESDAEGMDAFLDGVMGALAGGESGVSQFFSDAMSRLESMNHVAASIEVEVRVALAARAEGGAEAEEADPLVLDIAGDGIHLSGVGHGVRFDIDGDGRADRTSFVRGDDALLAIDQNGNGRIDNGRELFGDQNGAANGFEELTRYDANRDGRIDSDDPVYERLRLFQDLNGNGASDSGELRRLGESGIEAIRLSYQNTNERLGSGDRLTQTGEFIRRDGSTGRVADAMVRYLDVQA